MSNPQYARQPQEGGSSSNYTGSFAAQKETSDMPELGATFVPGGFDDYYMPEVIAPSPQRVMPEVPQNMQDGLQRMELEAEPVSSSTASREINANDAVQKRDREPSLSTFLEHQNTAPVPPPAAPTGAASVGPGVPPKITHQPPPEEFKPFSQTTYKDMPTFDAPSFSPFPRVKGDNVPPSDEEKEEILYNARQHVLNSNNVSMQLVWARDSLSWVEIAAEAHTRENKDQVTRPKTPKVEHELRVDAINIVDYLATQGHPEALFMRSKWLEFGRFGFRPDKKEAYLGYKKAAEQSWGRAEYRMGMLYEGSNDMEKALKHYSQGLEMKDSAASYRLGMMNLLGQHGYRKDYQRGLELIQSAADTSDEDAPQGAYVYGMLISRELPDISIPEGILPCDLGLSRQYIEKAAYLGFSKAQLKMGQAYELCQLGCDFNPALSLHYYGLAARQGQPEASLGVSRWFLFGQEGVFLKNEQLAYQYAKQAADAKLPTGEFAMGYYNEIGIHVQKDLHEARTWYERAAEHGNKDAIGRLDGLSRSKTLTKKDHETTALTRIKSQHGSQRGKRPERFSSRQHDSMPTLSEDAPPADPQPAEPTTASLPPPAPSPQKLSPKQEPARNSGEGSRLPAFTISLDQNNLAVRPKSTAPYPDDDRPAPLNTRPKSTAPYPDDDVGRPQLSPHYNPQIRQSANAPANRPTSAFGIRPVNSGGQPGLRPLPVSQSTGSLVPESRPFSVNTARPAGGDPQRGRVASAGWEPQARGGNYRGPSPGPGGAYRGPSPNPGSAYRGPSPGPGAPPVRNDYRSSNDMGRPQQQQQQPPQSFGQSRPAAGRTSPASDPTRNRLSKTNPMINSPNQRPVSTQGPVSGSGSSGSSGGFGNQPGRDYGPRGSSRPNSDINVGGSTGHVNSMPVKSNHALPSQGRYALPSQGRPQAGGVQRLQDHSTADNGRQSAPPANGPGSGMAPGGRPQAQRITSAPAVQTGRPGHAQAAPSKSSTGQGPATFEEMGIPQGKNDDDCVIM